MENFMTYLGLSFFPILGLVLFIIGVVFRHRRKIIARSCASTQGILVGNVKEWDGDSTSYYPVVEYIVKGKKYSVKGSVGRGRKRAEGAELKVMFDLNEPSTAFIAKYHFSAPNSLIVLGASFLFMGCLACYVFYLNL